MLYKYTKSSPKTRVPRNVERRVKFLTLSVSLISFVLGASLLVYSSFPYIREKYFPEDIDRGVISSDTQIYRPLEASSLSKVTFSEGYLTNVNKSFSSTNQQLDIVKKTFPEYASIKGEMKISIPSIKVNNVRVQLNVDSFEEKEYMPILDSKLAHFKGTSIPGKSGNTFVYGHSTDVFLANTNRNNPTFAFTFLNDINIGDEISVEYNGKTYKYIAQKIRKVSPEDISPIYTTSTNQTLTLMTCWPPGIGTQRLIVNTLFSEVV